MIRRKLVRRNAGGNIKHALIFAVDLEVSPNCDVILQIEVGYQHLGRLRLKWRSTLVAGCVFERWKRPFAVVEDLPDFCVRCQLRLQFHILLVLSSQIEVEVPSDDEVAQRMYIIQTIRDVERAAAATLKVHGEKIQRNAAADPAFMNAALAAYGSEGVGPDYAPRGADADEADAIISAAALRYFAGRPGSWHAPLEAAREGWIFGVPPVT